MHLLRTLIPPPLLSLYHRAWALGSAAYYGHPSRKLVLVGVTGTKGKSTTSELVAAVLRAAGHKVAVASTIHFVIGDTRERNLYKMTMPGRGRLQQFLYDAVQGGCTHAVVELTSEGVLQHRHEGLELDALVFTNIAPEHIERHGSFENYLDAKLELARHLARSSKRPRIVVANHDDPHGQKFLDVDAEVRAPFALHDAAPYTTDDKSVRFVWRGEVFAVPLPGVFNLYNCLAALTLGGALHVPMAAMRKALEHMQPVAGRAERVEMGQPFDVVVDYAHTTDSLKALYETYKNKKLICVLGATGGGRDSWKRPAMGEVADAYCSAAYLTNDDPYDEDPLRIAEALAQGFKKTKPHIELDRRAAIALALKDAKEGDAVLITGKGTDPYLMLARGKKLPWSDRDVAAEELAKLGYTQAK